MKTQKPEMSSLHPLEWMEENKEQLFNDQFREILTL
jgi:hypothetical protein